MLNFRRSKQDMAIQNGGRGGGAGWGSILQINLDGTFSMILSLVYFVIQV